MDLVDTLRNKIDALDDGEHISGIKATLGHIEVAIRHLARGQNDGDETAFTDVIYRTNQSFEGGVKEAYRVLTGHDPHKKTPYQIEQYLEKNTVFRERVLDQFSTYRTKWRNPSTHDYKLYFDESEAFLAIVSVSAFACLLSDQIAEKLAFKASKAATKSQVQLSSREATDDKLFKRASELVLKFAANYAGVRPTGAMTEALLTGSLHGAIASAMPDVDVIVEPKLSSHSSYRADMVLRKGDETLLVELKRFSKNRDRVVAGREQVEEYMQVSGINQAFLVFIPEKPEEIELLEYNAEESGAQIAIFLPKSAIARG